MTQSFKNRYNMRLLLVLLVFAGLATSLPVSAQTILKNHQQLIALEPPTSVPVGYFVHLSDDDGILATQVSDRTDESAKATDNKSIEVKPPKTDDDLELTEELIKLREDVRRVLSYYRERPESAAKRSPWGVMHSLIGYGADTDLIVNGKKANAIGWLSWNGNCRGQQLFYVKNEKLGVRQGPGVQGHHGQYLAMLAQSRVTTKNSIKVGDQEFTMDDLIEYEQLGCKPQSELTFKLIALSYYLDSDASWKSSTGQDWDIARLIKEELAQKVIGVACGGTHRMMGFSYAVRMREKEGKPLDGQWGRAKKYVEDYQNYTYRLQNRDGSFSTSWFEGRGAKADIQRRLQTTGHILEWMVFSLQREQLKDPRLVKAVRYLTNLMWRYRNTEWEIGPKGHAIHALALFDQRVFDARVGDYAPELAKKKTQDGDSTEVR